MFVGSNDSLPQDPQYQANLTELGYHLNDKGQFLSISNPAQFFAFFHTDNERANEKRKEAMHMCVRQIVKEELAKLGVKELFLTGEDGKSVEEVKPVGKHLPILVTEPVALKQKKDVIIVIGEQVQDLGIWAWRSLMKEGGIDDGSAVGLVKKLQDMRLDGKPGLTPASAVPRAILEEVRVATGLPEAEIARRLGAMVPTETPVVPGLVILNPGQLLYSHEYNTAMTQVTWMARDKPSAVSDFYKVHKEHNRIPGHKSSEEHLETVFEHVLPQLLRDDARMWIVGITDGAENFIKYMDAKYVADCNATICNAVQAMAFMEPTHVAEMVQDGIFKNELYAVGKCYIKSSKPKGEFLNAPGAANPINHPSYNDDNDVSPTSEETIKPTEGTENEEPLAQGDTEEPLAGSTAVLVSRAGNEMSEDHEVSDEDEELEGLLVGDGVHLPKPDASFESAPETASATSLESHFTSPPVDRRSSATPTGLEGFAGDPPHLAQGRRTTTASLASSTRNSPPPQTTAAPPAPPAAETEPAARDLEASISDLPTAATEPEDDASNSDSYDYKKEKVSCPTFSSGELIDELIWPAMMDTVLDHFQYEAKRIAMPGGVGEDLDSRLWYAARGLERLARRTPDA